ncbi:416_t:CDS:2 [Cetraspora pellucida]|uniref:416_t:CDS:1 n=1 Tax=Cetraspora pellucida TaxID=1433469 RepID=A0ACA9KDL3_9GLOM|nr:416_t:CDS:2 [Cetraspora pellucida]
MTSQSLTNNCPIRPVISRDDLLKPGHMVFPTDAAFIMLCMIRCPVRPGQ